MSYSEEDSDNACSGDEYGADNGYSKDCNEDALHEGGTYDGCRTKGGSQWSLDSATAAELFNAVSANQDDNWRSEGSAKRRREEYHQTTDAPTHEISCVSTDSSKPNERGKSLAQGFGVLAVEDRDCVPARLRCIKWAKQYSIEL